MNLLAEPVPGALFPAGVFCGYPQAERSVFMKKF
jgi:hypothetical protein